VFRRNNRRKLISQTLGTDTPQQGPAALLAQAKPKTDRVKLIVALVPVLLVLVTFLFWYQTWFGRALTDSEMSEYLTDTSVPHKTQHALAQLGERIARGDAGARRWYPQILALSASRESGFRLMAAWVMGEDSHAPEFHQALLKLLNDTDPMVRENAALALVRFGDASGKEELHRMLGPYTLTAPAAGTIEYRVKSGDQIHRGSLVARVASPAGSAVEVRSPLEGRVAELSAGNSIAAGASLAVISPGDGQLFETLRGLFVVGQADDLPEVERIAGSGVPAKVREQATLTAQAIRSRVGAVK
jgi:biotin carboxyl carrier protein